MGNPKEDIFCSLSKGQYKELRKVCIEMTHHFSMVKEVQMLYEMHSEILDASRELYYEECAGFPIKEVLEYLRASEEQQAHARAFRRLCAAYSRNEDLITVT